MTSRQLWNSKKAVFCWSGEGNLKQIFDDIVDHIYCLFGSVIAPKESIFKSFKIKSFSPCNNKPKLLAINLKFNPRYKDIIESSWKYESPSDFFKFKIDLNKNPSIKSWNHKTKSHDLLPIHKFKGNPGRYNFSQASYNYKSDILTCEKLNLKLKKRFDQNEV